MTATHDDCDRIARAGTPYPYPSPLPADTEKAHRDALTRAARRMLLWGYGGGMVGGLILSLTIVLAQGAWWWLPALVVSGCVLVAALVPAVRAAYTVQRHAKLIRAYGLVTGDVRNFVEP